MDVEGLASLYSGDQLDQLLEQTQRLKALRKPGDFGIVQQRSLQANLDGFSYDYCITSVFETDENGVPIDVDPEMHNFAQSKEEVLASYEAVAEEDEFSQLIYINPGWALSHKDVFLRPLECEPIYQKHLKKYDISQGFSIGYQVPLHNQVFVSFDYLGTAENGTWNSFDPATLEWASFPFALCWLYLKGRIGRTVLTNHITSIKNFRISTLEKLQVAIQHMHRPLPEQAEIAGVSQTHFNKTIYAARDEILSRFDDCPPPRRRTELTAILPRCNLLSMLQDQSVPFQYLPGRPMTDYFEQRKGGKR